MNKGLERENQNMVFIDSWFLFWRLHYLINVGLSKSGLCFQNGLYSQVVFNKGLTQIYRSG